MDSMTHDCLIFEQSYDCSKSKMNNHMIAQKLSNHHQWKVEICKNMIDQFLSNHVLSIFYMIDQF